MNSCDFYQELISRLVDGEVSHDEYEALMAHMKSCSRCNAMYAVFHDLSDLIADEAKEELPEGLHENIMAGVRRSAIEKKNRRMRSIGLRTALTAAACAVLVLFASLGFAPHERAENVSIRSPQAIETVLPAAEDRGFPGRDGGERDSRSGDRFGRERGCFRKCREHSRHRERRERARCDSGRLSRPGGTRCPRAEHGTACRSRSAAGDPGRSCRDGECDARFE